MSPTVDELRNEIRVATGRFEREIAATFTKEDLAAICEAVGYDIDTNSLPSKAQMRAGILATTGIEADATADDADRSFRKAELAAIRETLDE